LLFRHSSVLAGDWLGIFKGFTLVMPVPPDPFNSSGILLPTSSTSLAD
jgi:hypothetical protein